MKILSLIAFVIIFAISIVSGQNANQKVAIEKEIRKLDLAHADAILRSDSPALEKLWAEDFKYHTHQIKLEETELLKVRFRAAPPKFTSFIREPGSVLIHKNTVIVVGRETVVFGGDSPVAGKTINRGYTHIWMKKQGKWRLVFRQEHDILQK